MAKPGRIAIAVIASVLVLGVFGVDRASATGPADFLKLAPATHEVFLYLDVAQVRNSKLYADLRTHLFDQDTSQKLAAFEQLTGMRLPDDIDVVAASGKIAQDNEGCLYLRGRWDRQRIQSMFATNPDYAEITKPGGKIINYRDGKKGGINSLSFLSDNLLAIGDSAAVEVALAAFAGQGQTLATNPMVKTQIAECGTSPTALLFALKPQTLPPDLANVPGIQNLQSVLLLMLDGSEAMTVVTRLGADSQQMASKWLDIVRGLIAVGQIQNRIPALTQIANQTTAVQRGAIIEVSTQLKVADAGKVLRQRIAEGRARRPNLGGVRIRGGGGQGQPQGEKPAPAQW